VLPKVLSSFNTISAFDIYSVDSDEAMKRWSSYYVSLNASSLHRYDFLSALNASSPLLFMRKHRLTLHRRYFFEEILRLTLLRRYFLK
jgi:hypothetical protein